MHSFAHSLSHPLARREASDAAQPEHLTTVIALLVAALIALLISGALIYNSMNSEIETLQAGQVAAQHQSVQTNAFNACVETHSIGSAAKCRSAAATFAANDPDSGAFDKAVAYIYAQ